MWCQVIIFWCLLLPTPATVPRIYNDNDGITELDPKNFKKLVLNDVGIWVVEFYAPWCGQCKKFVPEFRKLAKHTTGLLKVGALNADYYIDFNRQYNVTGFPTIMIFGFDKTKPIKYMGKRLAANILRTVVRDLICF